MYEAAGGAEGMLRLADAWHVRVIADAVVSHALSHGFHPEHTERLAAYWAEVCWVARRPTRTATATKPRWCGYTAATARMMRWTSARLRASIRP